MNGPVTDEHGYTGQHGLAHGQSQADQDGQADQQGSSSGTKPDESRLWLKPAKIGAAVAAGTAAIAAIGPTDSGFAVCWSQRLGIDCPFCGGLRTVSALAHGNFMAALDHNLILAVTLPVLTVGWVIWMVAAIMNRPLQLPKVPNWVIGVAGVLVILFTVARNIDGPAWMRYLASSTY